MYLVSTGSIMATVHHVSGGLVIQLYPVSAGRVLGPARHRSGECVVADSHSRLYLVGMGRFWAAVHYSSGELGGFWLVFLPVSL